MAAEIALICEAKMKKILCFLVAAVMLLALCVSASADSKLDGSVRYDVTVSEDGKTAKVVVSLSDYGAANSMMMIPVYDAEDLTLEYGYWLIRGVMAVHWSEEFGDAAIAFSDSTDVNKQVFEMMFKINGDVKALDDVKCNVIVKTVENVEPENNETTSPETTAPRYEYVETAVSTPEETDPPQTEPPETDPPETKAPETEAVETKAPETEAVETEVKETEAMETVLPETEPIATEPTESDTVVSEPAETEPEATEADETDPPKSGGDYSYITESEYEKNKSNDNGFLVPILIVAGVAIVGVVIAAVLVMRRKK